METGEWREIERVFAAAVERPEQEWDALLHRECAGRPELRKELQSLLAAHRRGSAFLESKPERVGPYRLLEEIGHGGMGRVYRAERADGAFEQQVAVKLLSPVSGAPMAERFAAERQILAHLSHPNIARLLDGGETGFHIAYIAMELVEGAPVDEYCRDKPPAVRLRLFRQICDAVHYAHQNLVVHRDLKPANILVTAAGEPKLLDFGIAKILAPERQGQTIAPLMTPGYASPEQMRGEPVTTAADVYSLGVLLGELLTGERAENPAAVRTGQADLDAIVARATRSEARERYASAEALAKDIVRFLEHRPVEARRRAVWYVVSKFVARNRVTVGVGIAAAAAVTAAMLMTVHQSRVARRRFEDVRQLASSSLFQIHNAVAALPGSTQARKLIVTSALEALDRLSRDVSGDAQLQIELALAYGRLGDVQGLISEANLGDTEAARVSYEKAHALVMDLLRRKPDNDAASRALIGLDRARSVTFLALRRTEEGRAAAREMAATAEDRARRIPGEESERLLAGAYLAVADAVPEEDASNRRKASAIFEGLLAAKPADAGLQRSVALTEKTIASELVRLQFGEQALPHLKRAEELDTARLAASPEDRTAQMDLSFDYSQNATYYFNRKRLAEALENFQRSLKIRQALSASDPADARMMDRIVFMESRVGDTLWYMKRYGEAVEAYQESVRLGRLLTAKDPAQPQYQVNLATAQQGLAATELALGHHAAACSSWRAALEIYRDLEAKGRLRSTEREAMDQGRERFKVCAP